MEYVILTGSSRGLGEALTYRLLAAERVLFCISRNRNLQMHEFAKTRGFILHDLEYNLGGVAGIEGLMTAIFTKIELRSAKSISLFNNAAVVTPIKQLGECTSEELENHFNVNLVAPALLSAAFIKNTSGFAGLKRIVNISTGAAKNPYHGWGCYCSSKAGLEMLGRCIAVEQQTQSNPVQVIAFNPGIMDTTMQAAIREANETDFTQLQRFIGFKTEGRLASAEYVADKLATVLLNPDLPDYAEVDIKDIT